MFYLFFFLSQLGNHTTICFPQIPVYLLQCNRDNLQSTKPTVRLGTKFLTVSIASYYSISEVSEKSSRVTTRDKRKYCRFIHQDTEFSKALPPQYNLGEGWREREREGERGGGRERKNEYCEIPSQVGEASSGELASSLCVVTRSPELIPPP